MSHATLLPLACILLAAPLAAQEAARPWFVRGGGAWLAFGEAASSDTPAPQEVGSFRPAAALRWGVAAGRRIGPVELALGVQGSDHALEARDEEISLAASPAYSLTSVTLTAAWPVLRFTTGARLDLFAGPTLGLWSGELIPDTRTRWGGTGGLAVVAPLTGWLALDVHAALGVADSPLEEGDLAGLATEYEFGALWSRSLGAALRVRF